MRDPVAMTVSAPRFLTLGDEARLELALHNVEGQAGTYKVTGTFEAEPAPRRRPGFERAVAIAAASASARRSAQADRGGADQARLRITGPGGIDVRRTLASTSRCRPATSSA